MNVYVAAPYDDAAVVRNIHARLRALGIDPTSRWAEYATGAEDFETLSPAQLADIAGSNDYDVRRSHAMLVMARVGAGGEMFSEARLALVLGVPIVWHGRLTLSAWRPGVVRVATLDGAFDGLLSILGRAA